MGDADREPPAAAVPPASPGASDLRRAAARGMRWTTTSAVVRGVLGVLQVTVLARLLEPEDFGLAASATVALGLAGLFADLGLNSALIARRPQGRDVLSSLYWANVLAATAIAALGVAAAPLIAQAFGEDAVRGLVQLAALGLVVAAVGQQFQLLLQRELRFAAIAKIEIASQCVGFAVAVAAAVAGAGAYAIVAGMLAGATAKALQLLAIGLREHPPRLHLARRDLRGFVDFGAFQLGERVVGYAGANVDYLLIGLVLGPEALGLYFVAYQLVVKPMQLLNPALTRVAFPVLAQRSADAAAVRRGFLEVNRVVALVVGPVLAGLAAGAPHLVPVLFGAGFERSVPLVQVLALIGFTKALSQPIGSVLLATDRPDIGFRITAANLAVLTPALAAGTQFGVLGVAVAYLLAGIAVNATWPFVLQRVLGLAPRAYLRSVGSALPVAVGCGLAMHVVLVLTGGPDAEPHVPRLLAMVAAGAVAGGVVLATIQREDVRHLLAMARLR